MEVGGDWRFLILEGPSSPGAFCVIVCVTRRTKRSEEREQNNSRGVQMQQFWEGGSREKEQQMRSSDTKGMRRLKKEDQKRWGNAEERGKRKDRAEEDKSR